MICTTDKVIELTPIEASDANRKKLKSILDVSFDLYLADTLGFELTELFSLPIKPILQPYKGAYDLAVKALAWFTASEYNNELQVTRGGNGLLQRNTNVGSVSTDSQRDFKTFKDNTKGNKYLLDLQKYLRENKNEMPEVKSCKWLVNYPARKVIIGKRINFGI